jgi:hypothetical protein
MDILNFLISNGNKPAESRKRELVELQNMAIRINAIWTHLPFGDSGNWQKTDSLWNSLEIDGDGSHSSHQGDMFNLDGLSVDPFGGGGMMGQEWFWAPSGE